MLGRVAGLKHLHPVPPTRRRSAHRVVDELLKTFGEQLEATPDAVTVADRHLRSLLVVVGEVELALRRRRGKSATGTSGGRQVGPRRAEPVEQQRGLRPATLLAYREQQI